MNDEPSVVEMIDKASENGHTNQRLLTPSVTPEKLKTFPYAIAIPCPTRTMTRETGMSLANLVKPMFGNAMPISPDGLEVGEARNECVRQALKLGCEAILFIDYDVAVPANALVKLLSLDTPIAAGVYHLKQVPSYPLIFVKGWSGAFQDYEIGDLIEADGAGMGCTLIRTEVFKKIKPPWFRTIPGYIDENPSLILGGMTEDIYFCQKAQDAGYKIIVDTEIQCGHVDWRTGLIYQLVGDPNGKSKRGVPGWVYRRNGQYIQETVANAEHPQAKWANTKRPKKLGLKIDLGSGPNPPKGFKGIDLYSTGKDVINGSIEDLGWFREKYGLADEIRSSHALEHMSHRDLSRIMRDWVSTLVPGGKIEVRVPDLEYHMRRLIAAIDEGSDRTPEGDYWLATIYGWQIGEGQEHKTGFTETRLKQLALSSGLKKVKIEKIINKGCPSGEIAENCELVLTGERSK